MKKKIRNLNSGFTLVELIAIIIIISVISLVSFVAMTRTIKNNQIKEIEAFETSLKEAAQIYVETDLTNFPTLDLPGGFIQVTANSLIDKGYFKKDINNPTNCTIANTFVYVLKHSNNTISYSVYCTGDTINEPDDPVETYATYTNGTAVYFNPVTGTKCASGDAVSTTGTKTGCMKWYAFNDGGNTTSMINLILDHNTTATVAWNNSGYNVDGPTNVLAQLASDTNSWAGVPKRTDIYTVSNGTATYNINYGTYRARLITANEIAKITSNSIFSEETTIFSDWFFLDSNNQTFTASTPGSSNYDWLFDYTNECTTYGCSFADSSNYGYWTSTAVFNNSLIAWSIDRSGNLSEDAVHLQNASGIRPVITLSKNAIK